jgi:hypothetical protein
LYTTAHITAWCTICNNKVIRNDVQQFDGGTVGINDFLVLVYKHLQVQYPKFYKMDNLSKLGWLTTEVILNGDFDKTKYTPEDIAVVLSNANASLDSDMKYLASVQDVASPALFVYTLPNIVIGEVCIRHGFKGENMFFITPQFDAILIQTQVIEVMEHGAKACICGWVDVLGEDYKTTLFLVEKEQAENGILFSADNLSKIFDSN